MSITLSIPPAVVQEIREWAEANGTSLNQYIRDCLDGKVAEIQESRCARAKSFRQFALSNAIPLGKGFAWSREEATERKKEYGIQFYDAQIVATAEKCGCREIVSEDLNPGQTYRGMTVINPFAEDAR